MLGSSRALRRYASTVSLKGVFPPIPTTFKESGEISLECTEYNFGKWKDVEVNGYVVLGSNGEYVSLSEHEAVSFVKHAVSLAHSQHRPVIAGAGCESTHQTIRRCEQFSNVGADAMLIVTPHYFSKFMTEEHYKQHFISVADKCPKPIIIYNVPSYTHVSLGVDTIASLSHHPNIIGVKDSSGDVERMAQLVKSSSTDFHVLAGSASYFLPALQIGASGCVSALSNVLGSQMANLYQMFLSGDANTEHSMKQLHDSLQTPNEMVTKRFSVPGLKYVMSLFGYKPGFTRSPLTAVNSEQEKIIKEAFAQFLSKQL